MRAFEGQRIVVTRAAHQSQGLVRLLEAEGAQVLHCPVIAIVPPADWMPVDRAIAEIEAFAWLIFTSANAVEAFFQRAGGRGAKGRMAAVGPATAQALSRWGYTVELMPENHIAEGLIAALANEDVAGKRILLPRAAGARDALPKALAARGALVQAVEVYRNVVPPSLPEFPSSPDWVTFTSASTVKNLLALVPRTQWAEAKLASIGPETSTALRQHRLPVTVEASPSTQEALVKAMTVWDNSAQ